MNGLSESDVLIALDEIEDPELPVVSIVELGIVRQVAIEDQGQSVRITLAPTFAACPAISAIKESVREKALDLGFRQVAVDLSFNPPWPSDWITPSVRT